MPDRVEGYQGRDETEERERSELRSFYRATRQRQPRENCVHPFFLGGSLFHTEYQSILPFAPANPNPVRG